jgi:hypothetical protein
MSNAFFKFEEEATAASYFCKTKAAVNKLAKNLAINRFFHQVPYTVVCLKVLEIVSWVIS